MTTTTTALIQATLATKYTVKNGSAMTGADLGPALFAQWKNAVSVAHREFYKYECAKHHAAHHGEKGTVDATPAFNALQTILDLIGDINGHEIIKNQAMLDVLSVQTLSTKEPLAGQAELINSELKIVRNELKNISNGMNPDYIETLEKEQARLEEELSDAKKETGSCNPMKTRTSEQTFRKKFEKELVRAVINPQSMKSWEELEAEKEAKKAERKAKKQAKRQAAAKAKAEVKAKEQANA